jgi:hypothetical protein
MKQDVEQYVATCTVCKQAKSEHTKTPGTLQPLLIPDQALLTDKIRIHLRSASVRTYTFFTTGFPRFLSIRGARGLLALNQALI